MKTVPKLPGFEQLAAKHGVDLSQSGTSLKLTMAGREGWQARGVKDEPI